MKKITILAVALVAMSFASCKKERTCDCTVTSTTGSVTSTSTNSTKIEKISKGDGVAVCQKTTWTNTPGSGNATTNTWDCKLK